MPETLRKTIAHEFVLIGNTLAFEDAVTAKNMVDDCPELIDEANEILVAGEEGDYFVPETESLPIEYSGDAPGLCADLECLNELKGFSVLSSIQTSGCAIAESVQLALIETPTGHIALELVSGHDDAYADNRISSMVWCRNPAAILSWKNTVRQRITEFVASCNATLDALIEPVAGGAALSVFR